MRNYMNFQMSDYAAQNSQGWRVRWGPQELNMTLLVNLSNQNEWKLVYADEDPEFRLGIDGNFKPSRAEVTIYEKVITATADTIRMPKILEQCYHDHENGVPAPRRKNETPYIDRQTATILEQAFYERLVAEYLDTHQVFGVDKSGVELANRLGIHLDGRIAVSHYEPNTFQDDSEVEAMILGKVDESRPVLVIDDMLSSGRTAQEILDKFAEEYPEARIRFVTLYDIVASREVPEVEASVSTYQPISNHYWTYGRGADLLTAESRLCPDVMGADKAFGWETTGDVDDLRDFFNK